MTNEVSVIKVGKSLSIVSWTFSEVSINIPSSKKGIGNETLGKKVLLREFVTSG